MYEVYWCILYISDAFYIVIITCKDATHRSVVLQVICLQVCHRTVELCSADWDSSLLCDSVALILRYLCCGFCWCAGGVPRRAECRRWSLGCCGGLTHPLTCSWTVLSVTPPEVNVDLARALCYLMQDWSFPPILCNRELWPGAAKRLYYI